MADSMKRCLFLLLWSGTAILSLGTKTQANTCTVYSRLFTTREQWDAGYADRIWEENFIDDENDAIVLTGCSYPVYGTYNFDTPLTLLSPGDRIDFSYTLNIAYSGIPYGYSVGVGILTFRGNVNLHVGLGGRENGMLNAGTTDSLPTHCYSFARIGQNDFTLVTPSLSLKDVISSQEDTTISGSISWDATQELFVANFAVGNKKTDSIALAAELNIDAIGVTLVGPSSSTASLSHIEIVHTRGTPLPTPEAHTHLLYLLALPWLCSRRRR